MPMTVFDFVCIGYILHALQHIINILHYLLQPGTTSSETCSLLELSLCRLQFQVDINYADICDPVLNGPAAEQQCKEKLWDLWELVHVGSCRFGSPEFYSLLCVCVLCRSLACQTCELGFLCWYCPSFSSLERVSRADGHEYRKIHSLLPVLHTRLSTIHWIVSVMSPSFHIKRACSSSCHEVSVWFSSLAWSP